MKTCRSRLVCFSITLENPVVQTIVSLLHCQHVPEYGISSMFVFHDAEMLFDYRIIVSGIGWVPVFQMIVSQRKLLAHTGKLCNCVRLIHGPSSMSALLVSCPPKIVTFIQTVLGLNIGADKEAAEHFLSALNLQESSGTTSETS